MKPKEYKIHPGIYCDKCGEPMTEDEYSCGQCSHCGGNVADESDLIE